MYYVHKKNNPNKKSLEEEKQQFNMKNCGKSLNKLYFYGTFFSLKILFIFNAINKLRYYSSIFFLMPSLYIIFFQQSWQIFPQFPYLFSSCLCCVCCFFFLCCRLLFFNPQNIKQRIVIYHLVKRNIKHKKKHKKNNIKIFSFVI